MKNNTIKYALFSLPLLFVSCTSISNVEKFDSNPGKIENNKDREINNTIIRESPEELNISKKATDLLNNYRENLGKVKLREAESLKPYTTEHSSYLAGQGAEKVDIFSVAHNGVRQRKKQIFSDNLLITKENVTWLKPESPSDDVAKIIVKNILTHPEAKDSIDDLSWLNMAVSVKKYNDNSYVATQILGRPMDITNTMKPRIREFTY